MKDDPETLKTWTNTALGETWEEKGDQIDHDKLASRVENYDVDSLPDDILLITAGVDIQGDRIEALSQGWGMDYEHWDIEHKIFLGDPARKKVWQDLDLWLRTTYQCGEFNEKIAICCIDSGHPPDRDWETASILSP